MDTGAGALLVVVLFFAVLLAIDIALAVVFGKLAARKGYSAALFGTLVFFFGIIPMIVIAVLPDKVSAKREEALLAALQSQTAEATPGQMAATGSAISAQLPDPEGPASQGRYERLWAERAMFYTKGSPIVELASALLKDTQSGTVIAQVKFKSISKNPLTAVIVDIDAEDVSGKPLQGIEDFQYLDLAASSGDEFGAEVAVYLPDARTRDFTVFVRKVIFADGSSWEPVTGTEWKPVPRKTLEEALEDSELVEQYQRDTNMKAEFVPVELSDIWLCACGEVNHSSEKICYRCGLEFRQATQSLDRAGLEKRLTGFREMRRRKEREQAIQRRKAIRIGAIVLSIVIVATATLSLFFGVIKPSMDQAAAERALENPSVGDTVYFADIYWWVLDVQDGRALLISQDILEERAYNDKLTEVTWETCSLRAYLNGEFLNIRFSEEEQARIALSTVASKDNPEYETPGGSVTEDKVFLLSIDEAKRYFASDSDRVAKYQGSDSWWWLRSPGDDANRAARVYLDGSVILNGYGVDYGSGVRPALWLNL
ncbi:MAG: DUF6273 domain-containing protein [Coriobacteriales bacterium]|nr:DUF6273 domain-containing protein [Coriobacteriales bacterium]